nr:GTP-binding protein [Sporotomaculum syntrophicum]
MLENEFGDVGIDADIIQEELPIKEIYGGCICCSLAQDFQTAIKELLLEYHPDQILIEPSGVASLADIIKACRSVAEHPQLESCINHVITIVDVGAFDACLESFGGFYLDQIINARTILLSHFNKINAGEAKQIIARIRSLNSNAFILKEDWLTYEGDKLLEIFEATGNWEVSMLEIPFSHTLNEFETFSISRPRNYSVPDLEQMLTALNNHEYGFIVRAKGILELNTGELIHFNFTPQYCNWEYLEEPKQVKVIAIGNDINQKKIAALFG